MVSKTVYGARDQEILYYGQSFFYHIVSMVVKIELEVRMAVKIVRVLNTNAVVSSDQEGRELIITGAGIGFKKKKGENLDEALADKTYYLESVDDSRRLQEVVKEISEEYLEIVSRIVKTAREEGLKVRDSLYVTLTDHIPKEVIAMLNPLRERLLCVRGNCDTEVDQMVLDFPILADYALLYAGSRTVFATHGHHYNTACPPPLAKGDILLHGHTHVPAWQEFGSGNLYLNPGSVAIPKENSAHSYMMLTDSGFAWKDLEGSIYHTLALDCPNCG